jgi:ferric-dicitrate binding protein FerR (iron transport regulator)
LKRGWYTGLAGITLETGKKGEMIYVAGLNAKKSKSLFYGLIAPSGRTLSLKLPGGIQILLNTESTIQYPANFTNDSIHLIIDGEAFIEVPDSIRKFFQVVVNGMNIQTNGADFNVLAYKADSFVAVTPLKGNLEISSSNRLPLTVNRQSSTANRQLPINLTPGQQAVIRKDNFELIQNVDTSDAVAWKNEMFSFHQVDIETIMHTISRWYGKDVKYEGAIPDRKYDLVLPRGSSVIQLWHLLNQQGVNFTEDGDYFIIRFPGN